VIFNWVLLNCDAFAEIVHSFSIYAGHPSQPSVLEMRFSAEILRDCDVKIVKCPLAIFLV